MKITVEEVASPGCHICHEFEVWWTSIAKDWPAVEYKKYLVTTPEGQELVSKFMIMAAPGIIVNGELFSTGGFDKEKFLAKIKELSAQ
jgi:hypothetical protein